MYDEDLANLEEGLRRLKIEYHVFFNGNRKKPPADLKMRLERLIKKLLEAADMTYSQRFRFNTLITRFYVYRDLWRRMMAERELSTEIKEEEPALPDPFPEHAEPAIEAVRISIADPQNEEEKVRELYNSLLHVGKRRGDSHIPYQQFAQYITTQTIGIRQKYSCSHVLFSIVLEEGAIRFTAAADKP